MQEPWDNKDDLLVERAVHFASDATAEIAQDELLKATLHETMQTVKDW